MTRISRRVREEAIDACLIAADHYVMNPEGDPRRVSGEPDDPTGLKSTTLSAVWAAAGYGYPIADDLLEAAALLRDGWSPGDPVRLLRGES